MSERRDIPIELPVLARVEGEAALVLKVCDGRIDDLKLSIFEPPRLFEKFLEGRDVTELPDLVARVCGICPVAYQLSAVQAIERITGFTPDPWLRAMRRALYCGEWIQSHSLHIHLLAAPDFFGCSSVIELSARQPEAVQRGLRLQALGNRLIRLFGGRSVHPVGVRIGGFHQAPTQDAVKQVLQALNEGLTDAEALVDWASAIPRPASDQTFPCVSLRHPDEYPMNGGRIISDQGLDIDIRDFEQHFQEHQVEHSTALHCLLGGKPYLVGPLARLNLNRDRLTPRAAAALARSGLVLPSRNLFDSLLARAIEILLAIEEAIRLLADYHSPSSPWTEFKPVNGEAAGATEAPRGLLWHRYRMNGKGEIRSARLVPPTSQNQARIEDDLRRSLETFGLDRPEAELRARGETLIRNYDPCISCATHFLDLRVQR